METSGMFAGFVLPEVGRREARAALITEYASRSHPPNLERISMMNPWGEAIELLESMPNDFGERVCLAAEMYADQGIRFDGYMGSRDDGSHYETAADDEDGAYYGDAQKGGYKRIEDGVADDLNERVWVCSDLILHAYTMAGFPIREQMLKDYRDNRRVYTLGGGFPENEPYTSLFYRRIRNIQTYFARQQHYSEQRITKEQYRDPAFRPSQNFERGDVIFLGHYGDEQEALWLPQHAGIVWSVDERGLPDGILNVRVSDGFGDEYDGEISQTRTIGGERVHFERFSDRYSLIGFGRVMNWPEDVTSK